MKAVILAGGKGTRLRPLTYSVPKPLLAIKERPILEHIITYLKHYDIDDIILSIGYLGYQIENYFGDGSKFDVNIKYIKEDEPLGTAGCLCKIKDELSDTFLLMGGDNYTDLKLDEFVNFHKGHKGISTVALIKREQKVDLGVYEIDGSGIVTAFREKPKNIYLGGTMIFCLEPRIFDFFPKDYKVSGVLNLTDHILPRLLNDKEPMYGFVFEGKWIDIGNIEELTRANDIFD